MTNTELFDYIIDILQHDYSGYKDKIDCVNFETFRSRLSDDLSNTASLDLIRAMLRRYKDHHLQLLDSGESSFSNGFSVRRFQDKLYIVEVIQETMLFKGDVITHLGGKTIFELEEQYKDYFYSDDITRQEWRPVIKDFDSCTILRNAESFEFKLHRYAPVAPQAEYSLNMVSGVPMITLTDFANEAAVLNLIAENRDLLLETENLIIDVRRNGGGSDTSYFPLLDFLFDTKTSLNEVMDDASMTVLYSERSCDLRIDMFNNVLLVQPDLSEDIKSYVLQEIDNYKRYRGQGFVEVDDDFDHIINGQRKPLNIYILSDQYCGSSGDSFVLLAKKSSKVTVVGRNTMGVLDYSNVCFAPLSDTLQLMYPTSRMGSVDKGEGIDNIGVSPHVNVVWTPDHLNCDMDVAAILELIAQRNVR